VAGPVVDEDIHGIAPGAQDTDVNRPGAVTGDRGRVVDRVQSFPAGVVPVIARQGVS
jgi:hypothetical protein